MWNTINRTFYRHYYEFFINFTKKCAVINEIGIIINIRIKTLKKSAMGVKGIRKLKI